MDKLSTKFYSHCLKFKLTDGIEEIRKSKPQTKKDRIFKQKVLARFESANSDFNNSNISEPLASTIPSYRDYWHKSLLNPKKKPRYEGLLKKELTKLLFRPSTPKKSWKHIESALVKTFKKQGYSCLPGIVSPLQSLLVWKRERTKNYNVHLPSGKIKVKVIFLSQFIELGWLHYATFGKYYIAGWAKKSALYCVEQAYKNRHSTFVSGFLNHEAQHFWDYKNLPKLKPFELEFRAKLAELSSCKTPKKTLERFYQEASDNTSLPHSYGSYLISKKISKTAKRINQAASELLMEDTLNRFRRAK